MSSDRDTDKADYWAVLGVGRSGTVLVTIDESTSGSPPVRLLEIETPAWDLCCVLEGPVESLMASLDRSDQTGVLTEVVLGTIFGARVRLQCNYEVPGRMTLEIANGHAEQVSLPLSPELKREFLTALQDAARDVGST